MIEVGPRLNFATAFSTNAVAICRAAGLNNVVRIETSRRYAVSPEVDETEFLKKHHDRMTEVQYAKSLERV